MIAIDWLGCLLTGGALLCLTRGPWRFMRVPLCLILGEVGRLIAALAFGGPLTVVTLGGVFTGVGPTPGGSLPLSVAGLWVAPLLALPLGRRIRLDALKYACLGSGLAMLLG